MLDDIAFQKLCDDVFAARQAGWRIVLVLSGAVAAGMPALGITERPVDIGVLQAIAAVGQPRLIARVNELLTSHGVVAGQVLLTPHDFMNRTQYLHAREVSRPLSSEQQTPFVFYLADMFYNPLGMRIASQRLCQSESLFCSFFRRLLHRQKFGLHRSSFRGF